MKRLPSIVLLAAVVLSGAALADTVIQEIVARVNNDIVSLGELQRTREQVGQELRQGGADPARTAEREKNILRDLIDQLLLQQKAKELGYTGDTEVIKKLDEMRKQMNLETMEDLEKAAQQQGVSFEDYKQNLRNSIVTQMVISREVGSHIHISAEEAEKYYQQHKSELERPEQVRLSEIIIAPEAGKDSEGKPVEPTPQAVAAAEQKARQLLEEMRKGAKFDEIAKKNSSGPTAEEGGDIGYFKRGTLARSLEDITFNMKPGEISDVVRTKQGFVLIKVMEHNPAGIPAMKEVENQVQEVLYYDKLQPALRTYLTKLREDAFIDIKPGYVDTGASPNQTKPIITTTASAEEQAKAKKKKKKLILF